jgi:hypothetical protein
MDKSYIWTVGFKKGGAPKGFPKTVFISGEKATRKQIFEFLKEKDEEHDLRTIRFVEELQVKCEEPQLFYYLVEDLDPEFKKFI